MSVHQSGFVNIIGNPNVGKSTLMNVLVGEKMSIITSKPQTTRHRIFGIRSEDDYQIVFSDTPGIIQDPAYGMQSAMNKFAFSSFEDADILLFMTDIYEQYTGDEPIIKSLINAEVPKYLIINKIDLDKDGKADEVAKTWESRVKFDELFFISAEHKTNTDTLFDTILKVLPQGPPYYPKDELSDKPERFFVNEGL